MVNMCGSSQTDGGDSTERRDALRIDYVPSGEAGPAAIEEPTRAALLLCAIVPHTYNIMLLKGEQLYVRGDWIF